MVRVGRRRRGRLPRSQRGSRSADSDRLLTADRGDSRGDKHTALANTEHEGWSRRGDDCCDRLSSRSATSDLLTDSHSTRSMRPSLLSFSAVVLALSVFCVSAHSALFDGARYENDASPADPDYVLYPTGTPSTSHPPPPLSEFAVLMGGGTDVAEAFQAQIVAAQGGDAQAMINVVILRTSGADGYNTVRCSSEWRCCAALQPTRDPVPCRSCVAVVRFAYDSSLALCRSVFCVRSGS